MRDCRLIFLFAGLGSSIRRLRICAGGVGVGCGSMEDEIRVD